MVRVLIVDDSPTVRKLLRTGLESDPEIEVVGEACNGKEAVQCCSRFDPDIVTMDIHMPVQDGYRAIQEIMSETPRPIVVLTSTESDIRLGITYRAIDAGALMVLNKPHGLPGDDPEAEALVAQIKAMADVKVVRRRRPGRRMTVEAARPAPGQESGRFRVVAVGASTGGPPAIKEIFCGLPPDFSLPILVVQHISRGFVDGLARWLNESTPLKVTVAGSGEVCRPGTAYVAPDDRHLKISPNGRIWLTETEPVDGHRPSVTVLFESAAESYGSSAVGVILTGMGKDGAAGCARLKEAGGYTIAQEERSCIVFGMPKEAAAAGGVMESLSLARIGARLRDIAAAEETLSLHGLSDRGGFR